MKTYTKPHPPPFRKEIYNLEQVGPFCRRLAAEHHVGHGSGGVNKLGKLLAAIERQVSDHFILRDQVLKGKTLLEQVDRPLPVFLSGPLKGFPRIYGLATEIVAHTDAQIDVVLLTAFVRGYQAGLVLTAAELKAVGGAMKMALLENCRRCMLRLGGGRPGSRRGGSSGSRGGRSHGEEEGLLPDRVSLRNGITSLRILDSIDWQQFRDETSCVETILCAERSRVYGNMDFFTRDRYRDEVGEIAMKRRVDEREVALQMVHLADAAFTAEDAGGAAGHVGFYLFGDGRRQFRNRLLYYLGSITCLALLVAYAMFAAIAGAGHSMVSLIAVGSLLLMAASQFGKQVVDSVIEHFSKPEMLPRLDLSKGVPSEFRTLVVVPCLLTGEEEIDSLLHGLEVRFLANRQENLHFGLLTDFRDAASETAPDDHLLLSEVKQGVEALNKKYGASAGDNSLFFLFHRPRKWNACEQCWMGYERKRGKLMELNALLLGGSSDAFSDIIGDQSILPKMRYVITLDSDTQLPRDIAWKMIGTMAHPLNRAVFDEGKQRVVSGYGMLQPQVISEREEDEDSIYQRMTGSVAGTDPYTLSSAEVYQDIFGEGSFVGKGIYDIEMMMRAVQGRFPENRILSHDLIEGCYARSGLLNDLKLAERTVSYWADVKRRHRWIRGDWQIAAWAFSSGKTAVTGVAGGGISALSRWKIIDNLRRSLVPLSLLLLLLFGWLFSSHAVLITCFVVVVIILPGLMTFGSKFSRKPLGIFSPGHIGSAFGDSASRFLQGGYALCCYPFEVFCSVDAIIRALWRMRVSHRKLLEWQPSSGLGHAHSRSVGLGEAYRIMWFAPALGVVLALCLFFFRSPEPAAWVILAMWMVAPYIAWRMSRPPAKREALLTKDETGFLRRASRRTWAYYEDFCSADQNWLPSDHYKEHPKADIANYTSPTNLGLALLANLAARDFGYITEGKTLFRVRKMLDAMSRLERYKGHFYNWYNIETFVATPPRYVSTVDSGNLAGHLLILRQGLAAMAHHKIVGPELFNGILDVIGILLENAGEDETLLDIQEDIHTFLGEEVRTLNEYRFFVDVLCGKAALAARGMDARWFEALIEQCHDIQSELMLLAPSASTHIPTLSELADLGVSFAKERLALIRYLSEQCSEMADMDYSFLYSESEALLSIGYHVERDVLDNGYYDVLASEARMAYFVAICQNKLPTKSWFAMRRPVVSIDDSLILLSMNGTMFEYLMPLLVMPGGRDTLLGEAYRSAVKRQMVNGRKHDIPWGVSESAYYLLDEYLNYRYKVFGDPELSLKDSHWEERLVISPYASMLALMVAPKEACENLKRIASVGGMGHYGFYESIDYSVRSAPDEPAGMVVRSYMVHHQGMGLLSLAYLLLDKPMQKRFMADPELLSSLLLLQERMPRESVLRVNNGVDTSGAGVDLGVSVVVSVDEAVESSRNLFSVNNGTTRPIVIRIRHAAQIETVLKIVQLHDHLRKRGQVVTLLIYNEDTGCYRDFLHKLLFDVVTGGVGAQYLLQQEGGIFIHFADQSSEEERFLKSTAGLMIPGGEVVEV